MNGSLHRSLVTKTNIMKNLLFILLFACSICKAQYSDKLKYQPEIYVPIVTLASTFTLNEYMIHAPQNENLTPTEQRRMMSTIYFTGVFITVGSHYFIKWIKSKNKRKKRKKNRKILSFK